MSQIQFVRNLFSSSFKLHSEHFLVPPQPLRLFEPPFTPLTIIARPHSLPALSLLPAVFTLDKSEPLKSATSRHHSTKKKKKGDDSSFQSGKKQSPENYLQIPLWSDFPLLLCFMSFYFSLLHSNPVTPSDFPFYNLPIYLTILGYCHPKKIIVELDL